MKDTSRLYIQYSCSFEDMVKSQQRKGLYIGCSMMIICIFYSVSLKFMRTSADFEQVEWDVKTTTSSDFAVIV